MSKPIIIAVDAMGGDNAPQKVIDGIELHQKIQAPGGNNGAALHSLRELVKNQQDNQLFDLAKDKNRR